MDTPVYVALMRVRVNGRLYLPDAVVPSVSAEVAAPLVAQGALGEIEESHAQVVLDALTVGPVVQPVPPAAGGVDVSTADVGHAPEADGLKDAQRDAAALAAVPEPTSVGDEPNVSELDAAPAEGDAVSPSADDQQPPAEVPEPAEPEAKVAAKAPAASPGGKKAGEAGAAKPGGKKAGKDG